MLVLGFCGLTFLVSVSVDLGPFDRAPVGLEARYWTEATTVAGAEGTASLGSPQFYSKMLSPVASTEIGSVRRARRTLTRVFLPLFALSAFALTYRRVGWRPATVAGVGSLIAGPMVLSAGTFTPAVPAAILALLALVILDGSRGLASWGLTGALLGIAAWFHPGIAWSLGVLLLGKSFFARKTSKPLLNGAVLVGGWGVVVFLGSVLNLTSPTLPLISGIDVYRGHHQHASGVIPRRGDRNDSRWWGYGDYLREASRRKNRQLDMNDANPYWAGQAIRSLTRHPLAEIKRTATRTFAVFQGDPLPRTVGVEFLKVQGQGWGLDVFLWAGRLLIPLGLWGLLCSRRRAGWILWAGTLSGFLAAAITFSDADSRLVTLVCLLSGLGLLVDRVHQSRGKSLIRVLGGAVIAVGIWGFLPALGANPAMGISSDDHFQLGILYDREQRGSAAMREYERSLRLDSSNPYPRLAIAGMLARDNINKEATHELEVLRERHPDFVPGLTGLARLFQNQERWDEAAAVHGHLIELEPYNAEHWNNLGTMYVQIGYYEQAVRALESAIALSPNYVTAIENLDGLRRAGLAPGLPQGADPIRIAQENILNLIRAQNLTGARSALQQAYEQFGRDRIEFIFVEGTLDLVALDHERAITLFESIRDRMGNNVILLNNLGAAYRGTGQLEKAKEVYEAGLKLHPSNELMRASLAQVEAALDSLNR